MSDFAGRTRLDGRVALVTGAGAGIGRAIAMGLATAGATVVVSDLDPDAAEGCAEVIGRSGGAAVPKALDVADEQSVDALAQEIVGQHGQIDILVNNAGLGARMPSVDLATEDWRRALSVGLDGVFYCTRAIGRHMVARRRGAIVNIASIMGLSGGGLYPNLAYHAAKGALVNMTRALAVEWAPHRVRVNAVAPTFVATALTEKLLAEPAMKDAILAATPLGRLAEPDEVADAVIFLAGDAASMITGHTLPVDGGWLAK